MKPSPLLLEKTEYPTISVRANPLADAKFLDVALPVSVEAGVFYELDGRHFARITLTQEDEKYPYTVDIEAFVMFSMDSAGCAAAYKESFNPGVIAANVARILYSGARELLAFVTARAPFGAVPIVSLLIEPPDVEVLFEDEKVEEILNTIFLYPHEKIFQLKERAQLVLADENSEKPDDYVPEENQEKAKKAKKRGA
ncbi:hypothetical protein [Xanthomonas campestris]|uniref:hypothetical protein n=1 Tax=Xanthomonas campestris TaxID=339 RepID=UPI000E325E23|nr:hypothetical protein [Xanthomonas campestris]MEA9575680.1 hypothetical protein [Xanthomonas campestris]RFF70436.1 hypothetical protein D0A39_15870 [Xanthomonas campestris pv. campestris]